VGRKPDTNTTTKKRQQKALDALRSGSSVTEAAAAAGVHRLTLYRWQKDDGGFRAAVRDAVEEGTDLIEDETTRRAVHGLDEPVVYQGQMTFVGVDKDGNPCDPLSPLAVKNVPLTIRRPSDTLAIFLLKARRPKKYRENPKLAYAGRLRVSGKVVHDVRYADLVREIESAQGERDEAAARLVSDHRN
jgi:AcrR family transcriptional regulator